MCSIIYPTGAEYNTILRDAWTVLRRVTSQGYRYCNDHLLEINVVVSRLFDKLQDMFDNQIILKTTTAKWKIPPINKNSTLGEQIKYYRRLANIKQTDLCLKLGYDRGALHHIENREMK